MPIAPQITNTPITVSYNSTDYDADSVQDVQLTTTFSQTTQPTAIAVGDIWFDTANGNKQYSWDGSAWVARQDAAIATAASDAATALTTANAAQTTANGKNKVTYSTSAASGSNTAGDIWFQYTTGGVITAQWTGAGGTSWNSNTLASTVIASLDAGKITAGTISVALGITNPSGNFTVDASTGKLTCTGADISGKITSTTGNIGGFSIGSTYLSSGAGGTGFYINSSSGNAKFNNMTTDGYVYAATGLTLATGTCTVSAGANDFNNVGGITCSSVSASSSISTSGSGTISSAGSITANGELYAAGHQTTTNTANGYVFATGGRVARYSSSSLRYKENVTDIANVPELDPKQLLNLPIRAFTYKNGYLPATDDRVGAMIPGFIAEEVDAIYPIAADYVEGVESVNDRMLLAGALSLIQDLYKRIEVLESKI